MATILFNIEDTVVEERLAGRSLKQKNRLTVVFIVCFLSTFFSGIVTMLMSVYLPSVVKGLLGNITGEKMNYISACINAVFIFGWMFGGFAWGFICDKIGRSKAVALSVAFYGLFALLTGFSSSWITVSIYRFLSGFGIGGMLVTTTTLISELWKPKSRAIVLGIVSVAMPVGFFAAGAINYFVPDWRSSFLTGIAPLLLGIISIYILPESEKWKLDTGLHNKNDAAEKNLFSTAYKANLVRGSVIFGTMLIGLWAIFSWASTFVQSISAVADARQQGGLTMMILAIGGISGSFVSGWIANAIGLRKTMMMCFVMCFIMVFVVFKLNTTVTVATFIEMAVLAFFFGISQGVLAVYIPQLFPTVIRASATGFCFNIGRLFTGTVVFFIGALVSMLDGYGNAIFIFSFIFLIGLVTTFFSKEINQQTTL